MAPAASARAVMSSHGSSACWPTSTASATTSAPHSSAIHFTATDVSRPPEYARTTRFAVDRSVMTAHPSEPGQRRELAGDLRAADVLRAHEDQGVVAGHVAEHVGQAGPV